MDHPLISKGRTAPGKSRSCRWRNVGLIALIAAIAFAPNWVSAASKKAKSKTKKSSTKIPKLPSSTTTSSAAPSPVSTTTTTPPKLTSIGYDENIGILLRTALQKGVKVAYAGYGAGVTEGTIQYNVSYGARCVLGNVVTLEDPYLPGQGITKLSLKMDDRFYGAPKRVDSLIQGFTVTATERGTSNVGMADIWGKLQVGPSNERPLNAVIGHVTNRGMFEICDPAAFALPASSWLDATPTKNTEQFEQYIRQMAESNVTYVNIAQGFLTSSNGIDVNPYAIIGIGCKGKNASNTTRAAASKNIQTVTASASAAGAISVSIDLLEFADKTPAYVTSRTLFAKDTDPFAQSLKMVQDLSTTPQFSKADGSLVTLCSPRP
jgi:hypothetical protein